MQQQLAKLAFAASLSLAGAAIYYSNSTTRVSQLQPASCTTPTCNAVAAASCERALLFTRTVAALG